MKTLPSLAVGKDQRINDNHKRKMSLSLSLGGNGPLVFRLVVLGSHSPLSVSVNRLNLI